MEGQGEKGLIHFHDGISEDFAKLINKIFALQMILVDITGEEAKDGITVYPAGRTSLKSKLAKHFGNDTQPKEIAEYLLEVTENKIRSLD